MAGCGCTCQLRIGCAAEQDLNACASATVSLAEEHEVLTDSWQAVHMIKAQLSDQPPWLNSRCISPSRSVFSRFSATATPLGMFSIARYRRCLQCALLRQICKLLLQLHGVAAAEAQRGPGTIQETRRKSMITTTASCGSDGRTNHHAFMKLIQLQ